MSAQFTNQFWETGMGCPIRAEIWGYVFPGAPDVAAQHAALDGTLDHTAQSVGAAQMLAALAALAFFVDDVRRLTATRCGYDTDCTLATSGALIGQILGASRISKALKQQVGDELVMGIAYRRPEMTLSALARDTARGAGYGAHRGFAGGGMRDRGHD